MYDEDLPTEAPLGKLAGTVNKLPAVTAALEQQNRLLDLLGESVMELHSRLNSVLRQIGDVTGAGEKSPQQANPPMVETIENHNSRIAQLHQFVQDITNKLEI